MLYVKSCMQCMRCILNCIEVEGQDLGLGVFGEGCDGMPGLNQTGLLQFTPVWNNRFRILGHEQENFREHHAGSRGSLLASD